MTALAAAMFFVITGFIAGVSIGSQVGYDAAVEESTEAAPPVDNVVVVEEVTEEGAQTAAK